MPRVGIARSDVDLCSGANRGAVSLLIVGVARRSVGLYELCEVCRVTPKGIRDDCVVAEAVGSQLDTVTRLNATLEVRQERVAVSEGAFADEPRRDELRVGVNRRPGPDISIVSVFLFALGNVFLLGADERPNLICLNDR
ncbi:MAG: hypothetical protein WAL35_06855 [Acidimicrobiales bacterium]